MAASYAGAIDGNGRLYVPVVVFSQDNARQWRGNALVDTGAQFALIHPRVISEISLVAQGEAEMATAAGPARARSYIGRVAVAGLFDARLSMLESPSSESFVLGRQFLLKTRLSIDWPARSFSLTVGA